MERDAQSGRYDQRDGRIYLQGDIYEYCGVIWLYIMQLETGAPLESSHTAVFVNQHVENRWHTCYIYICMREVRMNSAGVFDAGRS